MSLLPNIAAIRQNYSMQSLTEEIVAAEPTQQFKTWLEEAIAARINEPTAMVLSTVNEAGTPSARVVLLKDVTTGGFVFFTNYESRKGYELKLNPNAALTFFWPELERQVRIEGKVQKVATEVSDAYFQSRPKGSQIGAWASPQSRTIANRQIMEDAERQLSIKFEELETIPRPDHWGGYILVPHLIEFWQGRPNRLHDRIVYELDGHNWQIKRLAP